MPPNRTAVLYTSLSREGALAEISFRQKMLNPVPTKPIFLHQLAVTLSDVLVVTRADLERLGVLAGQYDSLNYSITQEVGDAIWVLGVEGAIVPSARWACDNLVIFDSSLQDGTTIIADSHEQIDWQIWARNNKFLTL